MRLGSNGKVQRKIADILNALAVHKDGQHLPGIIQAKFI